MKIDDILRAARGEGSSDLHLTTGGPPLFRSRGELSPLPGVAPMTARDIGEALDELLSSSEREEFIECHDVEFTYGLPGVARFRVSYFYSAGGPGAVFRLVPEAALQLEALHLPPAFESLLVRRAGLLLLAVPMGSGRSTLCASIVDRITTTSGRLIVSLEDQVEVLHAKKMGVVLQREIGRDTESWSEGFAAALRQDAEVIVAGDLPDAESTRMALRAAEGGRLVVAAPAVPGVVRTLERLVERFPPGEQGEVRALLGDNLAGALSQVLVRRKDGAGRVAAHELLLANGEFTSSMKDGDIRELAAVIEAGKGVGMCSLDDSLARLVGAGLIGTEEAHRKSTDKTRFGMQ